MNIFYTPPVHVLNDHLLLKGQEMQHATKTLRYRTGDDITVVDGQGGWYEGIINRIGGQEAVVKITAHKQMPRPTIQCVLGIGIIKKRDRLEFAVEKAVELGVSDIVVFKGEHSVKKNVRMDRLESLVISAMKQSLRAYLPSVRKVNTLHTLVERNGSNQLLVAHHSGRKLSEINVDEQSNDYTLIVGPEGDFSDNELALLQTNNASFITLGSHRLRAETAAITFLNHLLYNE